MPSRTFILIIDDNEAILDLFSLIMEEEGYEFHLRQSVFENLPDIEILTPNLILLDLFMGKEQKGWKFLQRLKVYGPTASIPLLLCTAAKLSDEQEGYIQQQGIPVIQKPFELDELTRQVREALQSPVPNSAPSKIAQGFSLHL